MRLFKRFIRYLYLRFCFDEDKKWYDLFADLKKKERE